MNIEYINESSLLLYTAFWVFCLLVVVVTFNNISVVSRKKQRAPDENQQEMSRRNVTHITSFRVRLDMGGNRTHTDDKYYSFM